MSILLAGLWARRGVNAAILLVAVTAIGASVLGPMYGRAAAEHLLDSRIGQRAPYATGLSHAVPALASSEIPVGPDGYRPPRPADLVAAAGTPLGLSGVDRYWRPGRAWLLDRGGRLRFRARTFEAPLYWRQGMCDLAQVRGTCPSRAGEVLVQATMARTLGLAPGDRLTLGFAERWVAGSDAVDVERERTRQRRFTVVGTYEIADPGSPEWFDLSRFTGAADLAPPPSKGGGGGPPSAPALLTAPESMSSQTFVGGVDRPIDRAAVDLDSMDRVEQTVQKFRSGVISAETADQLADLDVATLFQEVRAERSLLSQVTVAALAPLVVLALLLLHALVSSAAQTRRPYVALAKLRGHSPGQVLRFALSEQFLVVVLAVPLAVALAWGGARLVARAWLVPGVPVAVDGWGLAALVVVTLAALVAAAAAAVGVIREPLSSALASSVRPAPSSRWSLALRSAVVAVAVASVLQLVTSDGSGQLLGLLAPLLIALATAVAGVLLLTVLSRRWVRRTRTAGGTASYLASRRLARRPDLTRLMIPLLLAVSVTTFATSASATADDWRVSRAKAEVGAPRVFSADVSPGRLLAVTREVDPEGRYVAAAAVADAGDDLARRLLVDTSRLGAVAAWDESWSDLSLRELQKRLVPRSGPPVTFHGESVEVALRDVRLSSEMDGRPALWLQYTDDAGEQADLLLGDLVNGPSLRLATRLPRCARDCAVEQLYLTGSASSVTDLQGSLTVAGVSVDGGPVDWRLTEAGAWRAARPFPVSLTDPPVVLEPSAAGLRLRVYLGQLPPGDGAPVMLSGIARITPSTTPEVVPVLVTTATSTTAPSAPTSGIGLQLPEDAVVGTALNGGLVPMRVVGRVGALPGLGDEGALSDLGTSLVEFEPPAGMLLRTQLWVAADAPTAVLDQVRDAGVVLSEQRGVDATVRELRSDAFSLGWRVFLVVGAATMLLAVFGVLASAVTQARWRAYEVASLRVVGVGRRTLVRASVLEYVVMLGFAVLLGVVAACLALTLALPSIDLGAAQEHDPAAAYSIHWEVVAAVAVSLFALASLIGLVVSSRVTRLGRPSTLRWAEPG